MEIQHILFDLDETLYQPGTGLWPILGSRMNLFIHSRLGIPMDQVEDIRERYYHTYGTSLRGLQVDYGVDANEYLDFVHDVPITDFIHPDPKLQEILAKLPINKVIFTNANKAHSKRVLKALGVEQFFSSVIDVVDMEPYCKPYPEAFNTAMKLIGDLEPSHYMLFDDSITNVRTAINLGMSAIQVSPTSTNCDGITQINHIHEIVSVIPFLLNRDQ